MNNRSTRMKHTRVKTARGRKASSTRWLQRQLNDPYVLEAQKSGYRSRAAFKLVEIDDKIHVFAPGKRVVDLGAAPGGWTQVAVEKTKADTTKGVRPSIVALDLLEMEPIPGALTLQQDFMADEAPDLLKSHMGGLVDIVMSDMAANTTGHATTDHLKIMALVEAAYYFACEVLTPGGCFIAKVFHGGTESDLLNDMKKRFEKIRHIKPPASRKESAEIYVVATGFRNNSD